MTVIVQGEVDPSAAIRRLTAIMTAPLEQIVVAGGALALKATEEAAVRQATPRATGRLGDSTASTVVIGKNEAAVLVTQDAKVDPNEDGSGGGYSYFIYEVKGHGAVDAPAQPFTGDFWNSRSTGKGAFYNAEKGFGPRRHIKAVAGYDYPHMAMENTLPDRVAIAGLQAQAAAITVMRIGA